jgi:hypothetical protein
MSFFHKRAITFGACHLGFCAYLLGGLVLLRMLFGAGVEQWGEAEGDISLWVLGKYLLILLQPLAAALGWWWRRVDPSSGQVSPLIIAGAILWSGAVGYGLAWWAKSNKASRSTTRFTL